MKEEHLLTGLLEETNEPYAIAKIAGIKMCEAYHDQYGCNFISVMPTNLYGPNDNFDLKNSHVLPALIRKFHEAKESNADFVEIWGTGSPKREFLYVEDMAEACVYLMLNYNEKQFLNIGCGEDISIKDLKKGLEKSNYYNYKNKCKFIFIEKAEKLSSTAANSLLKLIEETKEDTRIILLTNNEELVLPTIRSRCQIIRTETMGDDSMENYLREKYIDQSNEVIKQAVKLSAGRFKLAEKYLTDLQLMKRIGWWQDQFLQVLDKKGVEGLILAEELARTKEDKLLIMDSWISLMERYLKERIKAKKEKSAVDKLKFNLNDLIELKNYLTTTNSNQKLQWENFFVQLSN